MTETRPEAGEAPASPPPPAPRPAVVEWLTSADHKHVGIAFLYTSLLFAAVAAVAAVVLRVELLDGGIEVFDADTGLQPYTLLFATTFFLFLAPAFVGLATHLVPLQIGASRLAFPRLSSYAYWLYLGGGVLALVSYLVDGGPYSSESLLALPAAAVAGEASDLWLIGMGAVAVAMALASANLATTLIGQRAPGMTMDRVPVFSWATLVSSLVTVLAAPVFVAGLVLHAVNLNTGGQFFGPAGFEPAVLWQKVLWLFGRPELLALVIMAAGVVGEVVQTAARRSLIAYKPALGLLGAMGALSFLVWAHDTPGAGAPLAPTFSVASSLFYAPLGLLVLMYLGTLAQGRARPTAALAHATGFVLVLGAALVGAVSGIVEPVQGGTAWAEGHLDLLLFAAPVFGLSAGLYYWAPKLWGRALHEGLGYLQFVLLLAGSVVMAAPYYTGLRDFPRFALDTSGDFTSYNRIVFGGTILVAAGLVVFVLNVARSVWAGRGHRPGANPWGGGTLEWVAPSPPPLHNFDPGTVPAVRSERPLTAVQEEG